MSTTDTSHEPAERIDPARAFERYVWTNPGICNHCFERVQRVDAPGPGSPSVLGAQLHDTPTAGHVNVNEAADDYGARYTARSRTYCRACASIGLVVLQDIMSRRQALCRVAPLAFRLLEERIPVSAKAMKAHVREAKSDPDRQGEDREIFAEAVRVGIEATQ